MFLGDHRVEDEKDSDSRWYELILRNSDSREFCLRVNLLFAIWQICLPIQQVIPSIGSLLNPVRQVVLLMSPIPLNLPCCFYLHPLSHFLIHNSTIIAEHNVKSSLSISSRHDHELTWSTAYTKYIIQWVQHPPKIVILPIILTIISWPLNEASASGMPPYKLDCHQPALHVSRFVKSPYHIPMVASWLTEE